MSICFIVVAPTTEHYTVIERAYAGVISPVKRTHSACSLLTSEWRRLLWSDVREHHPRERELVQDNNHQWNESARTDVCSCSWGFRYVGADHVNIRDFWRYLRYVCFYVVKNWKSAGFFRNCILLQKRSYTIKKNCSKGSNCKLKTFNANLIASH